VTTLLKPYLGFVIFVPISILLWWLPLEPGILPLETLFDRFGMIPAHIWMACLWLLYLLGIPAALAAALNRISAVRGVCLTYLLVLIGLIMVYSAPDGPDWYFRVIVCVISPIVLCAAYLLGHVIRVAVHRVSVRRAQVT
jgi:hypothetical protein